MLRLAILLHRYLGIALGVSVSLWCLSGIVMMYVQYPSFLDTERVTALEPLDLDACCTTTERLAATLQHTAAAASIDRFEIEMRAGRPVLRLFTSHGLEVVDLVSGAQTTALTPTEIERIAAQFAHHLGIDSTPSYLGPIERDQWTVSGYYAPHRPLHRFAGNDKVGTEWYVSGTTGEILLRTTATQRFWNWLGAVTHWIYFTGVRERTTLWAQLVIWLAVAATVLSMLGLYVGIRRYGSGPKRRWTPYRGWWLWHHLAGLVFGMLALTWAVSGLLSMNPWGLLGSRSFTAEQQRLRGAEIDAPAVLAALASLHTHSLPEATTRVDSTLVGGGLALVAWHDHGRTRSRLELESLTPTPIGWSRLAVLASGLRPGVEILEQRLLEVEDAYYFGRYQPAALPVYRVRYADGERFYLDGLTGALAYAADLPQQRYRWWFSALHRGDFSALLRTRPLWDVWFLPLLVGVTASAITGTWLGARRLIR